MNRTNFGRVSGVVIDVCRSHGAWFDRGELGAIRQFLRRGGLKRYKDERSRRIESEARRHRTTSAPPTGGSLDDIYDVLVGERGGWSIPSRVPRLLVVAVFTALGGCFLWSAFHPGGYFSQTLGLEPVLLGLACLYFAWRALEEWAARRGR